MIVFWALTTVFALIAVASALRVLLVPPQAVSGPNDVDLYRDQLAEIDRDLARGTLNPAEAERTRTEIARRLIRAEDLHRRPVVEASRRLSFIAAALSACVVIGGSIGLYSWLGAPGYPDLPLAHRIELAQQARADRPNQAQAQAQAAQSLAQARPTPAPETAALMGQLRKLISERPNDLRGHILLVQNEARLGNYVAALEAQERVIDLRGRDGEGRDLDLLVDLMVRAAGGYVSPEAETILAQILERAPQNQQAQYYWGLMLAQTGRPDLAFPIWRSLLEQNDGSAPFYMNLRGQLPELAARAGVAYELPPLPSGPDVGDIAAAQDLAPAERAAMIEGMVSGLAQRLANQGGPAPDWARLIRAYGVLGQTEAAAAIWAEAETVFAIAPEDLEIIRQSAIAAGVAQ